MQDFLNYAALERGAAFTLSGRVSRYCLMALMAAAIMTASGAPLAAIWLGLALLADESRKALDARIAWLPTRQTDIAQLALEISSTASFAAAPAIVWYARADFGATLAVAMLCALAAHAALNTRHGRARTLAACAPYGLVALLFVFETTAAGALGAALVGLACGGYLFASALQHTHRVASARRQDAEWVRQLNMHFGEAASAAWEIDYERAEIVGGDRLAQLIGRPVSYGDIVENACFAAPADRALAHAVFAPHAGAMRQVAIEHDVIRADGSRVRVRHQGVVRTSPDGAPTRLSCVTRLSNDSALARIDAVQGPEDGPLVIVIQDQPDERALSVAALAQAGFRACGAGDNEAGLRLARTETPALVLLDISLPDHAGWRVLRSLKQDLATRDIPVVVLSVSEDRARALSLGAAEHMAKPIARGSLAATIMRYARQRAPARSAQGASPLARGPARKREQSSN